MRIMTTILMMSMGAVSYGSDIEEQIQGPVELGRAYNAANAEYYQRSCVQSVTDSASLDDSSVDFLEARYEILSDASLEVLTRKLSLGGELGFGLEGVELSGQVNYASENAATTNKITRTFISQALSREVSLRGADVTMDTSALEFLTRLESDDLSDLELIERRRALCGDGYLSSIRYKALLSGNLSLEFATESDKQELSGKLGLGLNELEDFNLDFDASRLTEEERGRVTLIVAAQQAGGEATELLRFIPEGNMTCTLDQSDVCLEAFRMLRDYARTGFVSQLQGIKASQLIPDTVTYSLYQDKWELLPLAPDSFLWL